MAEQKKSDLQKLKRRELVQLTAIGKHAKSLEEALVLVREGGYDFSEDVIRQYWELTHSSGELSEEELANVSGGGCNGYEPIRMCRDWDPVIDDDPYDNGTGDNPCTRCRNAGANINIERIREEKADKTGDYLLVLVPDSYNWCWKEDGPGAD